MATYTTPPTAVAGAKLTAADWNTKVRDSIIAVAKPPSCRVKRTTSHSIPNNVATAIPFTAEDWDTQNLWVVGNPTVLLAPVAGIYLATFTGAFAANAVGVRQMYISDSVGGIGAIWNAAGAAGWYQGSAISGIFTLAANGYVQCLVHQSSGAALNLDIAATITASLTLLHYL